MRATLARDITPGRALAARGRAAEIGSQSRTHSDPPVERDHQRVAEDVVEVGEHVIVDMVGRTDDRCIAMAQSMRSASRSIVVDRGKRVDWLDRRRRT
jgi:hypothetical protein